MVSADDLALVQVVDTTDEVCAIATGGAPGERRTRARSCARAGSR
jgi:hypothetical protein